MCLAPRACAAPQTGNWGQIAQNFLQTLDKKISVGDFTGKKIGRVRKMVTWGGGEANKLGCNMHKF